MCQKGSPHSRFWNCFAYTTRVHIHRRMFIEKGLSSPLNQFSMNQNVNWERLTSCTTIPFELKVYCMGYDKINFHQKMFYERWRTTIKRRANWVILYHIVSFIQFLVHGLLLLCGWWWRCRFSANIWFYYTCECVASTVRQYINDTWM